MMTEKIQSVLESVLPKETFINVSTYKACFGGESIKIFFAANDHDINKVQGQKPQAVSLRLQLNDLDLAVQVFGGNGGQSIYRDPNMQDPKEKYLAMKSVKIPFRRPQANEEAVLKAIKKFAENWLKALNENKEVLRYKDIVDYTPFLT